MLFQRLVEALDFALGLWVVGLAVLVGDPDSPEQGLHGAAATPGLPAVKMAPLSVSTDAGRP